MIPCKVSSLIRKVVHSIVPRDRDRSGIGIGIGRSIKGRVMKKRGLQVGSAQMSPLLALQGKRISTDFQMYHCNTITY